MFIKVSEKRVVCNILKRIGPTLRVWLFGSRVHGNNFKPFSDLDLAVEHLNGGKVSPQILSSLRDAFEESDLPWKVEILDLNDISDTFKNIVAKDQVLFDC